MPFLKQNLVEQDTSYKEKYIDASEYDCLLEDLNAQDIDLMNWMDDNNYLLQFSELHQNTDNSDILLPHLSFPSYQLPDQQLLQTAEPEY